MKRPLSWIRSDTFSLEQLEAATAKDFQKMIRAEAGAKVGRVRCVMEGEVKQIYSEIGYCVCVTCGRPTKWNGRFVSGGQPTHAGHFIQGRKTSLLFEETNCHCQCSHCNLYLHANLSEYTIYMKAVYSETERARLLWLDDQTLTIKRDDLNAMRDGFKDRWKRAVKAMK